MSICAVSSFRLLWAFTYKFSFLLAIYTQVQDCYAMECQQLSEVPDYTKVTAEYSALLPVAQTRSCPGTALPTFLTLSHSGLPRVWEWYLPVVTGRPLTTNADMHLFVCLSVLLSVLGREPRAPHRRSGCLYHPTTLPAILCILHVFLAVFIPSLALSIYLIHLFKQNHFSFELLTFKNSFYLQIIDAY